LGICDGSLLSHTRPLLVLPLLQTSL